MENYSSINHNVFDVATPRQVRPQILVMIPFPDVNVWASFLEETEILINVALTLRVIVYSL